MESGGMGGGPGDMSSGSDGMESGGMGDGPDDISNGGGMEGDEPSGSDGVENGGTVTFAVFVNEKYTSSHTAPAPLCLTSR